ncbi:MAG: hypothetical protein U0744_11360 [Gemmataceae bacterium]
MTSALDSAKIDNVRFTPDSIEVRDQQGEESARLAEQFAGRAGFLRCVVANGNAMPRPTRRKCVNARLDFDDLLYWPALTSKTATGFARNSTPASAVLIDEYQDTTGLNTASHAGYRSISRTCASWAIRTIHLQVAWFGHQKLFSTSSVIFEGIQVVTSQRNFRSASRSSAPPTGSSPWHCNANRRR